MESNLTSEDRDIQGGKNKVRDSNIESCYCGPPLCS